MGRALTVVSSKGTSESRSKGIFPLLAGTFPYDVSDCRSAHVFTPSACLDVYMGLTQLTTHDVASAGLMRRLLQAPQLPARDHVLVTMLSRFCLPSRNLGTTSAQVSPVQPHGGASRNKQARQARARVKTDQRHLVKPSSLTCKYICDNMLPREPNTP